MLLNELLTHVALGVKTCFARDHLQKFVDAEVALCVVGFHRGFAEIAENVVAFVAYIKDGLVDIKVFNGERAAVMDERVGCLEQVNVVVIEQECIRGFVPCCKVSICACFAPFGVPVEVFLEVRVRLECKLEFRVLAGAIKHGFCVGEERAAVGQVIAQYGMVYAPYDSLDFRILDFPGVACGGGGEFVGERVAYDFDILAADKGILFGVLFVQLRRVEQLPGQVVQLGVVGPLVV